MRQGLGVRGSPLIRTLLLVCALLLAGWGMWSFTRGSSQPGGHVHSHEEGRQEAVASLLKTGVAVKFSQEPEFFQLADRQGRILFQGPARLGQINLDDVDPVVLITVKWKTDGQTGSREGDDHFVKLTLEPWGRPTVFRYFETPERELTDVWELPTP